MSLPRPLSIYDPANDAERRRQAQAARQTGQELLHQGRLEEAAHWLDRAARLARGDKLVALLRATLAQRQGDPTAAALFRELAEDQDLPQAWCGLAAIEAGRGAAGPALAAIAATLARHVPDAATQELASGLAARFGAPGWCGMRRDGTLLLGTEAPVRLTLDRRPLPSPPPGTLSWPLPATWRTAARLHVRAAGRDLLGSPIDLAAIRACRGAVWLENGALEGWARHPADPTGVPEITLRGPDGTRVLPAADVLPPPPGTLHLVRGFRLAPAELAALGMPLHVCGEDGSAFAGSPLGLPAERRPAWNRPPRRRQALATTWPALPPLPAALLVLHARGGGVRRAVQARVAKLAAAGYRPILLLPAEAGCRVEADGHGAEFPLPDELPALLALLRSLDPRHLEIHHLLGHHPCVARLPELLGLAAESHVHDYAWFCPRITLTGVEERYCGEPALAACEACVAAAGSLLDDARGPTELRRDSAALLAASRRVVVPDGDVATRLRRHFPGIRPVIVPLEDDAASIAEGFAAPAEPAGEGRLRVVLNGALQADKGYHILLDCARDAAARGLALEFRVVGFTMDDRALLETGHVFITGAFEEAEAVALIRAQAGGVALLPAIWPETWSYALGNAWRAGLPVVAFDIGAPAARIRRHGHGLLLPLGLSAARLNAVLLSRSWRKAAA